MYEYYVVPQMLLIYNIKDIKLSIPVEVTMTVEEDTGLVSIVSSDLDITEVGMSCKDAMDNFIDFFYEDSYNYLNTNDDKLSEDAIKLKNKYKRHLYGKTD